MEQAALPIQPATSTTETPAFEAWSILELLGHVRLAGKVSEAELFGAKVGRIDIPIGPDETGTEQFNTQYFGGGALYRLTPTTEEIAKATAYQNRPRPVHIWAPRLSAPRSTDDERGYEANDDIDR